jgi:hypothetical protein
VDASESKGLGGLLELRQHRVVAALLRAVVVPALVVVVAALVLTAALSVVTRVGRRPRPMVVVSPFVGVVGGRLGPGRVAMGSLMLVVAVNRTAFRMDMARGVLMPGGAVRGGGGLVVAMPRAGGDQRVGRFVVVVAGVGSSSRAVAVAGL